MRKLYFILIIIGFGVINIAVKCHKETPITETYITVVNNSSNGIYYEISDRFPDTTLNNVCQGCFYQIASGKVDAHYFQTMLNYHSPVIVFFINKSTFESTPYDTIRKKNLIAKKIKLTKQDLINSGWKINFP
jgi:hypothetical protein